MLPFDELVDKFAAAMKREYVANSHKNLDDPPNWTKIDPRLLVNDMLYHAAKFSLAMKEGRSEKVQEYAADVGCMILMALAVWESRQKANQEKSNFGQIDRVHLIVDLW